MTSTVRPQRSEASTDARSGDAESGAHAATGPTPEKVLDHVIAAGAVRELNRLLWIDPRRNHGVYDPGWSCRDHAATLGAVLVDRGCLPIIQEGRASFVLAADDRPIVFTVEHVWLVVAEVGLVDVSIRFDGTRTHLPSLPPAPVIGNWTVRDRDSAVCFVEHGGEFDDVIAHALELVSADPNVIRAVYHPTATTPWTPEFLSIDRINSPLTDRLRGTVGPHAYMKLVAHLIGLVDGTRRPLGELHDKKAWRLIARIPDEDAEALNQQLAAKLVGKLSLLAAPEGHLEVGQASPD